MIGGSVAIGILTVITSLHYQASSLFTNNQEDDKTLPGMDGGRDEGRERGRRGERDDRFRDPNWDVSSFFFSPLFTRPIFNCTVLQQKLWLCVRDSVSFSAVREERDRVTEDRGGEREKKEKERDRQREIDREREREETGR